MDLRPTINRLRYRLNLKIPESEIGYIAVHIGAAAERNRKTIKTLVICHSGIGTSQLVSARLERSFKEIETIGIVSYIDIKKELLDIEVKN